MRGNMKFLYTKEKAKDLRSQLGLQEGVSTEESIKTKYESNPDTNAFTDDEKAKLEGLPSEIPSETEESIKTKYESNANTNAFTDAEKEKLESLEVGIIDVNSGLPIRFWTGTQSEYDSIEDKQSDVVYLIKE